MKAFINASILPATKSMVQQGSLLNLQNAIFITINGVDYYLTATTCNKDYYLQYKK